MAHATSYATASCCCLREARWTNQATASRGTVQSNEVGHFSLPLATKLLGRLAFLPWMVDSKSAAVLASTANKQRATSNPTSASPPSAWHNRPQGRTTSLSPHSLFGKQALDHKAQTPVCGHRREAFTTTRPRIQSRVLSDNIDSKIRSDTYDKNAFMTQDGQCYR